MDKIYRPQMSQQGLAPTHEVSAINQFGDQREVHVAGESPLTLKVNDRSISRRERNYRLGRKTQ